MSDTQHATIRADAWDDYRTLATHVGVDVRQVTGTDPWVATALLEDIWGTKPVEAALLVALEHAGGYAVVAVDASADAGDPSKATDERQVVGAAAGFFATPLGVALHSHVAGVRPGLGRPGIGRTMKLHQRAWCLDRGVTEVTWTFDPLVSRNAHINIVRLGAQIDEYLVDFYGNMPDGINAGQGSDRALVRWRLNRPYLPNGAELPTAHATASPVLVAAPDGSPHSNPAPASAAVTLAIPRDIEGLRVTNPAQASAWRTALRDTMAPLLGDGWRVTGFEPHTGYLVERPTS
ncbi:hypothetical protein [Demequina aurantiaca]|uniref:hypothetical protein n=1 Tax=Demequina aurantiaca TaxID=676200 RepID=UPI0007863B75|nr:hypothetical protein [Demequina aurantiaca]